MIKRTPTREIFSLPDGGVGTETLPQLPGIYLAYAFDWGYAACWFVHVLKDRPEHLERLRREHPNGDDSFYIYVAGNGDTLTMYFEGATRAGLDTHQVPPRFENSKPCADGYVRMGVRIERVEL